MVFLMVLVVVVVIVVVVAVLVTVVVGGKGDNIETGNARLRVNQPHS